MTAFWLAMVISVMAAASIWATERATERGTA